jgi:Acyl-CoA thioesterase C-terminal domain/Acyl-CoA thioesterase N-terminal domain
MSALAVFEARGERFVATELARGPWDPDAQHGGAPAALLMRAFERVDGSGLAIARVTYELLRPVPLRELSVRTEVLRPGRRVQLLEGSLVTADGVEVVRARALRVRHSRVLGDAPVTALSLPGPERGRPNDYRPPDRVVFGADAMEIRFIAGAFYELGPATAWFRLRHPLLAGEEASPLQRLAAAGDFGNGISAVTSWEEHLFINPDLTLYIEREPVGEWIGLESETRIAPDGVGVAESVLYDERGRVGRALQALLIAPR